MTNLKRLLVKLGACSEAVKWTNGKELAEAWANCERADWMLWLVGHMAGQEGWPTLQQIVLVACRFAEDALPIFEKKYPDDERPRQAIEVTRLWCEGKATIKEVRKVRSAAYASAYAAAAADAAAVAHAAVRDKKQKEYADIIRQELVIPAVEFVAGKRT